LIPENGVYLMPDGDGRAIVTVLGRNQVGILAGLTAVLAEANINIRDISQTILQEFFTMIMVIETRSARCAFNELQRRLQAKGEELGVQVTVQKAEIFKCMHRI
jgi:ACT domain-containing protein